MIQTQFPVLRDMKFISLFFSFSSVSDPEWPLIPDLGLAALTTPHASFKNITRETYFALFIPAEMLARRFPFTSANELTAFSD